MVTGNNVLNIIFVIVGFEVEGWLCVYIYTSPYVYTRLGNVLLSSLVVIIFNHPLSGERCLSLVFFFRCGLCDRALKRLCGVKMAIAVLLLLKKNKIKTINHFVFVEQFPGNVWLYRRSVRSEIVYPGKIQLL